MCKQVQFVTPQTSIPDLGSAYFKAYALALYFLALWRLHHHELLLTWGLNQQGLFKKKIIEPDWLLSSAVALLWMKSHQYIYMISVWNAVFMQK